MSYNVLLPNSTLYFVRCWLFTWMSGSGSWVAKDFSVSSGVGSHDLAPGTRSTRWPSTLVKEPCFVFGGSCSLSMGITVVSISMSYNNKWLIKPVHYHTEFPMAVLLDLHQLTQLAPNKNHWMCTLFAVKNGTENPWNPNVVPISTPVVPFFFQGKDGWWIYKYYRNSIGLHTEWPQRQALLKQQIQQIDPEILCLQETWQWWKTFEGHLQNYTVTCFQ